MLRFRLDNVAFTTTRSDMGLFQHLAGSVSGGTSSSAGTLQMLNGASLDASLAVAARQLSCSGVVTWNAGDVTLSGGAVWSVPARLTAKCNPVVCL